MFAGNSCLRLLGMALAALLCGCGGANTATQKSGPQPRAVVSDENYEVGTIVVGRSVTHVFRIRNNGNAVLRLGRVTPSETSPFCAVEHHLSTREVLPGETANVTLTITPQKKTSELKKGVYISTNDAITPSIRIGLYGVVEELLELRPDMENKTWTFESKARGEPPVFDGTIHSAGLEEFSVEGIDISEKWFTAKAVPLEPAALGELEAKSGYSIQVAVDAPNFVGRLEGNLRVRTDVSNILSKQVKLFAVRWGPVQFLPNSIAKWNNDRAVLDLGRFSARQGMKVDVFFVITENQNTTWDVTGIKADPPDIQVAVERVADRSTAEQRWYRIRLEIPAGAPPITRYREGAVEVSLSTTHSGAKTIRFIVQFLSFA